MSVAYKFEIPTMLLIYVSFSARIDLMQISRRIFHQVLISRNQISDKSQRRIFLCLNIFKYNEFISFQPYYTVLQVVIQQRARHLKKVEIRMRTQSRYWNQRRIIKEKLLLSVNVVQITIAWNSVAELHKYGKPEGRILLYSKIGVD